jgi:hypothetical protein
MPLLTAGNCQNDRDARFRLRDMEKEGLVVRTDLSGRLLRSRSSGTAGKPIAESRAHTVPNRIVGIISNLERSALEEWLNSEELHRPQAADGSTLICLNSLLAYVRKTKAT